DVKKSSGILSDKRLRQGIADHLDREAIIKTLKRDGEPARTLIPRGFVGHVASPPASPRISLQELRVLASGQRISLVLHSSYQAVPQFAEALTNQFEKMGFRLDIRYVPFDTALGEFRAGKHDLMFKGEVPRRYGPETLFVSLVS